MPADNKIILTEDIADPTDVPNNLSPEFTSETTSETDVELSKTSNTSDLSQSLDLMDIEPPLDPGFDWTLLADSVAWVIALLLLLWVLFKFGQRFYQPAALHWQLKRLASKYPASASTSEARDDVITFDQAWLLYGWCLKLQTVQKTASTTIERASETTSLPNYQLNSLLVKVNQLSFSKEPVSRETYLTLLHEAELALRASSGWFSFKDRLVTLWKRFIAGRT